MTDHEEAAYMKLSYFLRTDIAAADDDDRIVADALLLILDARERERMDRATDERLVLREMLGGTNEIERRLSAVLYEWNDELSERALLTPEERAALAASYERYARYVARTVWATLTE